MNEWKILLADDHPIVRQGLLRVLESEPDLTIVGTATDGLQAIELVEQLSPDVLILDLMLPGLNGLEVAKRISKQFSHTKVLILSMHDSMAYVSEALKNGALAYVLKESATKDLVVAIREVLAGRRYLSDPLSEYAMEGYIKKIETGALDPWHPLTEREREILQLLAEGHNRTEIAKLLSISVRTVDTHRTNIMQKLDLDNQADLYRVALSKGLIPPKRNNS